MSMKLKSEFKGKKPIAQEEEPEVVEVIEQILPK